MSDVLSVGVIGAGTIARAHMNAVQASSRAKLVAVMDINAERVAAAAKQYDARAYQDANTLIQDPEVQAVHVCTPHYLHADQTVATAQAGKHVFVEKPMALTVADCDRMVQACEEAGRVLMVGQVMRHYPANLKIRQLIADGAIGDVGHLIRRRYGYFDPTSPDSPYGAWYVDVNLGGICLLYGFGPHEYDILHWYLDSPIETVYAQGTSSTELYSGQKDSYTAILNHANGAVSVLSQSIVCKQGAHDQYIIGSTGTLMLSGDRLLLNGQPVEIEGTARDGMQNQIDEFASCCLEGRTPDADGKSVRHTMAAIEAAMISAERNVPVSLSEFG